MSMIKCPEPDCNNIVSDQAVACPNCGHPVRKVEFKFVTVEDNIMVNQCYGKAEYEMLLRNGWQVVEERREELLNDFGELYAWRWSYKLQK